MRLLLNPEKIKHPANVLVYFLSFPDCPAAPSAGPPPVLWVLQAMQRAMQAVEGTSKQFSLDHSRE